MGHFEQGRKEDSQIRAQSPEARATPGTERERAPNKEKSLLPIRGNGNLTSGWIFRITMDDTTVNLPISLF